MKKLIPDLYSVGVGVFVGAVLFAGINWFTSTPEFEPDLIDAVDIIERDCDTSNHPDTCYRIMTQEILRRSINN